MGEPQFFHDRQSRKTEYRLVSEIDQHEQEQHSHDQPARIDWGRLLLRCEMSNVLSYFYCRLPIFLKNYQSERALSRPSNN